MSAASLVTSIAQGRATRHASPEAWSWISQPASTGGGAVSKVTSVVGVIAGVNDSPWSGKTHT